MNKQKWRWNTVPQCRGRSSFSSEFDLAELTSDLDREIYPMMQLNVQNELPSLLPPNVRSQFHFHLLAPQGEWENDKAMLEVAFHEALE